MKQASPVDEMAANERILYESLPDDMEVSTADIHHTNERLKETKSNYKPLARRTLERFIRKEKYFKRTSRGWYLRKH